MLKITLKKSLIACRGDHRLVVKALGLKKRLDTVEHKDTPEIRGMINKVNYLLEVTKG
jgi:large subunit ribosomal protein L30